MRRVALWVVGCALASPALAQHQGGYVAAGVSYGIADRVPVVDSADFSSRWLDPKGASFTGSAGYNMQHGNWVFGGDLAGRIGNETIKRSRRSANTFGFTAVTISESQQIGTTASVHAAARAGYAIGDALLFVKVGAGGTEFQRHLQTQASATFCQTFAFVNGALICTQTTTNQSATGLRWKEWLPSVVVGGGIEHNFNRLFVRLEGEAEAIFDWPFRNDPYWVARAKALIGIRLQ